MTPPYATRLRIHLATSRERGLPFEEAWTAALRAHVPPEGWGNDPTSGREANGEAPLAHAKRAFRDGYLRLGRPNVIGAIAERDRIYVERYYEAPPITSRRCGWGGTYCREQGDPWLCPEHAAIIDVIPERCGSHMCRRDADPGSIYCAKHAYKAEANTRGAEMQQARAA